MKFFVWKCEAPKSEKIWRRYSLSFVVIANDVDVDGDKSLVVADNTIVPIAERNMNNIVPLYYNMKKASPIQLSNQTIYDGLNAAFSGGNIGDYSNNISKIWNSDVFIDGTEEERQEAIDLVKLLCMENNFVIDYAKTLYKPKRPKQLKEKMNAFTNNKVPHFFVYAKDKKGSQVERKNESFVNKLDSKIKGRRINTRAIKLNPIDYRLLMNNPNIKCNITTYDNGKINEEMTDPMIVKYFELNNKYHFKVNNVENIDAPRDGQLNNSQLKEILFFGKVSNEIKTELSKFGYTDSEIADILVKVLYYVKPSSHKSVLWFCYGEYIVKNLIKNGCKSSTKVIQCVDCGEWFEVNTKDNESCRCSECVKEHKRELKRLKMQRYRERKRNL